MAHKLNIHLVFLTITTKSSIIRQMSKIFYIFFLLLGNFSFLSAQKLADYEQQLDKIYGTKLKSKVLLMGTFPCAYPQALSYKNAKPSQIDMRVDTYQKELERMAKQIAKYNPTEIFVEINPSVQGWVDTMYYYYRTDNRDSLKKYPGFYNSEYVQIAFRIAKMCDIDDIQCVDALGANIRFGKKDSLNIISTQSTYKNTPTAKQNELKWKQFFDKENEMMQKISVIEYLLYLNSTKRLQRAQMAEWETLEIGNDLYPSGADVATFSYNRNMRIYANILRRLNPTKPHRVLVLFGAGHIPQLSQFFEYNDDFELVKLEDVLKN